MILWRLAGRWPLVLDAPGWVSGARARPSLPSRLRVRFAKLSRSPADLLCRGSALAGSELRVGQVDLKVGLRVTL